MQREFYLAHYESFLDLFEKSEALNSDGESYPQEENIKEQAQTPNLSEYSLKHLIDKLDHTDIQDSEIEIESQSSLSNDSLHKHNTIQGKEKDHYDINWQKWLERERKVELNKILIRSYCKEIDPFMFTDIPKSLKIYFDKAEITNHYYNYFMDHFPDSQNLELDIAYNNQLLSKYWSLGNDFKKIEKLISVYQEKNPYKDLYLEDFKIDAQNILALNFKDLKQELNKNEITLKQIPCCSIIDLPSQKFTTQTRFAKNSIKNQQKKINLHRSDDEQSYHVFCTFIKADLDSYQQMLKKLEIFVPFIVSDLKIEFNGLSIEVEKQFFKRQNVLQLLKTNFSNNVYLRENVIKREWQNYEMEYGNQFNFENHDQLLEKKFDYQFDYEVQYRFSQLFNYSQNEIAKQEEKNKQIPFSSSQELNNSKRSEPTKSKESCFSYFSVELESGDDQNSNEDSKDSEDNDWTMEELTNESLKRFKPNNYYQMNQQTSTKNQNSSIMNKNWSKSDSSDFSKEEQDTILDSLIACQRRSNDLCNRMKSYLHQPDDLTYNLNPIAEKQEEDRDESVINCLSIINSQSSKESDLTEGTEGTFNIQPINQIRFQQRLPVQHNLNKEFVNFLAKSEPIPLNEWKYQQQQVKKIEKQPRNVPVLPTITQVKSNCEIAKQEKNQGDEEREFLKGTDLSSTNVNRPQCPLINPKVDKIEFMQIDIDFYTARPPVYVHPQPNKEVSILRIFGITANGNSVMAHVHNFRSYFYVQVDTNKVNLMPGDLEQIKQQLNAWMKNEEEGVLHIELVQKASVRNYQEKLGTFLKIYTFQPKHVNQLKTYFESAGCSYNGKMIFSDLTFESNLPYPLRFMIDTQMGGMSWLRIEPGKYTVRSYHDKMSTAQIEIDIENYNNVICLPIEGDYSKIAPLRIMSFDIECSAQEGRFPLATHDPIIQIANIVKTHGETEPFVRNVFTLKHCAPIVGSQVFSYQSEQEMLEKWRDFVLQVDPDIITGYNIVNFDLPYIINRSEALKMNKFPRFSRILNSFSKIKNNTFSSKALGTRETKDINIEGRIQFDMLQVILREHKLSSYSLNSVSAHFLGEQKEDVHHSIISELQNKNEFTRRRLAIYCLKDAYLPMRLLEKLMCLFNLTEMARVTGVPISYLFTRGQQIKVASQLYRKAQEYDLIIPVEKVQGSEGKYEGAVVIEPTRGYYTDPVATLDFASLYPSIMMAHNLCYSTLIQPQNVKNYNPSQYTKTPNGDCFMRKDVKKGLLPMILEELISARKRARAELAKATDPFEKAVLDGRQLALKISANSVYGFTGAQVGQLPCLEISSSVTAFGRQMIEFTRDTVQEHYSKKNGCQYDAQVIYGDTDSVMVKFGVSTIEEAMKLGKEAANYVSQKFISPIKLEFEKVYCPYLLMNKKRYAGLLWTKPEKYDKMDAKGIETVRRDNCGLVKDVVQTSLNKLLIEKDKEGAIDYCKGIISDLLQNRIDLSLLVITKGLGKKTAKPEDETKKTGGTASYQAKQAHVELAERMRKRDEASAPSQGDRVQYVMLNAIKGAKGFEKSEDPLYVLEHNLPIDYNFYLDHQIKQPLLRIFEPILANVELTLFQGEHTRNIYVPKVSTQVGGLGKFTVIKKSCLGCKNVLSKPDEVICQNCKPKMKQIYIERKQELNLYEKNYADLWVQCQRCQGSLHEDIICTSKDCPIFYRRIKAKKNLEEMEEVLDRFLDW